MTRASWIAILGKTRINKHSHGHAEAHDAPPIMKFPLLILAFFSALAGFIGIPEFIKGEHGHGMHLNLTVAACSVLAAALGIAAGTFLYAKARPKEDPLVKALGKAHEVLVKKYYLDDFFSGLAGLFQNFIAKILFWFDQNIVIQKGVNGAVFLTSGLGSFLRRAQTGFVQTYAMVFSFGVLALIYFFVTRGR